MPFLEFLNFLSKILKFGNMEKHGFDGKKK
jgi:hypothetical protein